MKQSKDTKLKEFQPNQNSALRDHVGFADQQMDNSPGASSPNYVQFPISLAHYMMYERWMKNPYRPSFFKKRQNLTTLI